MKVLLVYPEFPDTFWSFKHALPFQGKRSAFPPLGLLTISAMLPGHWQKRLVDLNVQHLKDSDLDWADVVFFSAMIVQGPSLKDQMARARKSGKRIVLGGPITSSHDPVILQADHIVEGEAEEMIAQVAEDLERAAAKPHYSNPQVVDVTRVPLPDLHLAPLRRYSSMSLQFSRGCPFTCEFCDIIEIYGRRPRTKTPDQVCAELDQLHRLGWRGSVFMVDDNFIGNKKSVKALLPRLVGWMRDHKFPFTLYTEASLNLAEDEEMLELMREAHFTRVFLGIETPVAESLKETTKFQNLRKDLLESVRLIQAYGMEVMAGFIVGFDNDPPDVFDRQIEFIRQAAIPLSMVGLLNALPNTQLGRRLKAEGRLLKASLGNNTLADLNFIPRMDTQVLLDGYRRILQTIYEPREYFQRASTFLSHLGKGSRSPLVFSDLMALGRSLWRQGLLSSYRGEYWKFLGQSLRQHRHHFSKAITLAIMGHHFFELTSATAAN
ncbi:MAG TPA: DUF4070 domain-containing protein [Terriglobia bacterium]|nr:DUF4070 domain-containing protein [Terriglobia bacterium]